jgi:hypothetical protein
MDRRSFLKWIGAAAATTAAAYEIDYEKLLWVPGQKSYHFIHKPAPTIATDAEIDLVSELHGVGIPRYHMTVAGQGTFLYDDQWRLLNGAELVRKGIVTEQDIKALQAAMMHQVKTSRLERGFIGEFAQLPDWFPGQQTRRFAEAGDFTHMEQSPVLTKYMRVGLRAAPPDQIEWRPCESMLVSAKVRT